MNWLYLSTSLLIFIAAAFLVEALWRWWFSTQSHAAKRFNQRMHAMGVSEQSSSYGIALLKQRRFASSPAIDRFLHQFSLAERIDGHLQQAGSQGSVGRLLGYSISALIGGLCIGVMIFSLWWMVLLMAVGTALIPLLLLARQRRARLQQVQQQLPEVADLIARSLRAGHALPATLKMVAEEMPAPICDEFGQVADEIQYGLGLPAALQGLAQRIPLDDLRFLVIAILMQRDTGGNLAELMQNMSHLIRERLKLLGRIKALSAEGLLSGWILFLLPVAMALLLSIVNPSYLARLVEDPIGKVMLAIALLQMLVGGLWMRHIVQLRV
jgi:tight adherence protein B